MGNPLIITKHYITPPKNHEKRKKQKDPAEDTRASEPVKK